MAARATVNANKTIRTRFDIRAPCGSVFVSGPDDALTHLAKNSQTLRIGGFIPPVCGLRRSGRSRYRKTGRRSLSGGESSGRCSRSCCCTHNEVVSRDQLVDALWGERPPPSAAKSLDTYVYRLRKLLGHDRLAREAGGYLLHVEPGELDADEFERLVASAGAAAESRDYEAALGELTRRARVVARAGLGRPARRRSRSKPTPRGLRS